MDHDLLLKDFWGLQYCFGRVFGEKWRQLSTGMRHQGSHGGDGYTECVCNLRVTEAIRMIMSALARGGVLPQSPRQRGVTDTLWLAASPARNAFIARRTSDGAVCRQEFVAVVHEGRLRARICAPVAHVYRSASQDRGRRSPSWICPPRGGCPPVRALRCHWWWPISIGMERAQRG